MLVEDLDKGHILWQRVMHSCFSIFGDLHQFVLFCSNFLALVTSQAKDFVVLASLPDSSVACVDMPSQAKQGVVLTLRTLC